MHILGAVLATLFNTLVVAWCVRRLVGVPVGWLRTIAVTLALSAAVPAALNPLLDAASLPTAADRTDNLLAFGIVTALAVAWCLAICVAILALLEVMVPSGSLPGPVTFVSSLPARARRARRYLQIASIVVRRGLGPHLVPSRISRRHEEDKRVARSLRLAMTDAGVTFVKLGQMLSTRPDLLPQEYLDELSQLQTRVPAAPWDDVLPAIEKELGCTADRVLASVVPQPMAAASVAQVHQARLHDGTKVVLKVQRPGAAEVVEADLDILLRICRWLGRSTAWGQSMGVSRLAEEFATSLREELDYRVEASAMRVVSEQDPYRVIVPAVHAELSGKRLLVMDHVEGVALGEAATQIRALSDQRRTELAEQLMSSCLHQVLVSGTFHADLHPGNVMLTWDDEVALLDFGSVGRLDRSTRQGLIALLAAVQREDALGALDALTIVLDPPRHVNDRRLERELGDLIQRYGRGHGPGGTGEMFRTLIAVVVRHGFGVSGQVAAVFRLFSVLEGTLRLLDPSIDLMDSARRIVPEVVGRRVTLSEARAQVESQAAAFLPALQRLPRRVGRMAEQVESGQVRVRLAAGDDEGGVVRLVHHALAAFLAAAITLVGVIFLVVPAGPMLTPTLPWYSVIGATAMLFGFVLAARVLFASFRVHSGRVLSRDA